MARIYDPLHLKFFEKPSQLPQTSLPAPFQGILHPSLPVMPGVHNPYIEKDIHHATPVPARLCPHFPG